MSVVLLVIVFALGWAAATGGFSLLNLLLGAVIGGAGLYLIRDHVTAPGFGPRVGRILALMLLFVRELLLSALRVARLVLRPNLGAHLNPAIIAFPLTATRDAEITLLANLITLTPGTLSVDVSEDKKLLYIHAIDVTDRAAFVRGIAEGFEAKVMGAFR